MELEDLTYYVGLEFEGAELTIITKAFRVDIFFNHKGAESMGHKTVRRAADIIMDLIFELAINGATIWPSAVIVDSNFIINHTDI